MAALRQAEEDGSGGPLTIDASGVSPAPSTPDEACKAVLGVRGVSEVVVTVASGAATMHGNQGKIFHTRSHKHKHDNPLENTIENTLDNSSNNALDK